MSESAHELGRLLASEITRRLSLFAEPQPAAVEVRAALHALKGSAAMAGHTELSLVIAQCAQRVKSELPGAVRETRAMLQARL